MGFDVAKYNQACIDYQANWEAVDRFLYSLCKTFPGHQRRDGVNAKLWIIGRTYATGIERRIESDGSQGSSMGKLADHLWANRAEADRILNILHGVREPLNTDKIATILSAHGRLLRLLQRILKDQQSPRSFASKYLHFHNSAIPIFDNVAGLALNKLYRRDREFAAVTIPKVADGQYAHFFLRFWRLYEEARSSRVRVSVKLLDNYLLTLAREAK